MSYLEGAEKYYDLFGEKNDVEFYLEQAKKQGGKALEIGVGTARLAIQLARKGVETWGIDFSQYMLNAAERNLAKETRKVQNLVHLKKADATDFDLGVKFGLVYFPSGSFDHMLTPETQKKTLQQIRKHVEPDGAYAFDLYIQREVKEGTYYWVQKKPLTDEKYVMRTGLNKTNPEKRLLSVNMWYELYDKGKMIERYHDGSEVYIHSPEGIRKLLHENKFKIIEEYGDHEKSSFKEDSDMIVIVAEPE